LVGLLTYEYYFSFVSGITILGVPAEVYRYGTQYVAVAITFLLIGLTTATIFVPLYTKLQISSCYEVIRRLMCALLLLRRILMSPLCGV
jgi:Na+/proline symporter